ncbi:hypothetical protein UPYG_G00309180 [Umbra pygmaea]|uniref:Coiled-coil domain-containing protein 138 n=1 Tax=Umbra pygmaea TaxID=75934 RepID=A0ABD0WHD5_UMBPY
MSTESESDVDETVEILKMKYLQRKQVCTEPKAHGLNEINYSRDQTDVKPLEASCNTTEMVRWRGYNRDLHDLFQTVANPPDRFEKECSRDESDDDLSYTSSTLLETQIHYTQTDVSLPSSLANTSGSCETEPTVGLARGEEERAGGGDRWARQQSSSDLCPSAIGQVYQEMLHIYQQLQTERLRQLHWADQLQDREKRLLHRESQVKEVKQLQDQLREKTRDNKRLMSSFNSIKELNDTMKQQLNELSEQNKRLENQYRKVHARLENLQRKFEYSLAQKGRENVCLKTAESKPSKPETTATSKPAKGTVSPVPLRLLVLLLDWVLDGQALPPVPGDSMIAQGQKHTSPPAVSLHDRCSKVLPLLVEQLLQPSASSDPLVALSLVKFLYWSLTEVNNSPQPLALSSTMRRLGELVSRGPTQQLDTCGLLKPRGLHPPPPLCKSPCPQTRLLSSLIILKTITQADVVAQALVSLQRDLACVDVRGLFLQYGGVSVLLGLLHTGKGGLQTPMEILLQLSGESRYLSEFLSACSTEEFFRTAALLVKNPRLDLPLLEKLSIVLQKLSKIRKNRRLFELCSLHHLLKEVHRTTDPTLTFLLLNISSILLNLK